MKFPNGSRLTAEDRLRMNERVAAWKAGDPIPCTWPQWLWLRRRFRTNNLIALGMIAFNLIAPMGIIWFLWR